ncbi:hypothetical protein F9B77_08230 [Staphylococcus epidermidis]|uniref:Uncharacterized protein n=1 Tax=Staphylococcus epidermidis (strain ATCC 12228 / FDA PCI 1200) TaxID=176280 RepID=A0A0H2VIW1_STAES|nr:hypothetical protein SE_1741 [Staphylococcus epidermidis ATCC 12228]EGG62566.1 hypothetical protein SEVCU144_0551 [Staphylococcus epidermidis VCU144]EGS74477.1 hypothetical protein SEVCU105_0674 [Staphylococcus epidermidis VCU105]EHQ76301.1 hypothetical protein SEVCU057_1473 [Staphylococcus epidermidis VCU057]EHR80795.1 hypothetical protein SEVCU117_0763 [Staphylococcus epidermidis VCU117]EHR81391.1 hypothetical protein SEVCU120_1815 [Staphylococcus epidermidis VCU120]EHR90852.1 hypothetic
MGFISNHFNVIIIIIKYFHLFYHNIIHYSKQHLSLKVDFKN